MRNLRSEGISLLGGPLSAVLVGFSFEPYRKEIWAWLALLPLLLSIGHHQSRPGMRLAHGISFGFTLSAWSLSWFFQAFLAAFSENNGPAGPGSVLTARLCFSIYWPRM